MFVFSCRGVPTEFIPEGIKFCRLLLGVISRLVLLSQLLLAVARGIRGAPEFARLFVGSLTDAEKSLLLPLLEDSGALAIE